MTHPDEHEMDEYERDLVEEAWGFAAQTSPGAFSEDDLEWLAEAVEAEVRRRLRSW